MILLLVAVSFLFQGCVAETCYKDVWRQSIFGPYLDTDSFSCSDECCGETFERYCCPENKDHWSVVAIVAVSIGGVVGLLCAIALIICIVKMCTKTGTHGRVVQPGYNMQVWATNTGTAPGTSGYYPSVEPSVPPPYTGPGIPRPHPEKSNCTLPLPST